MPSDTNQHSKDYIERTIATVRNHADADSSWPQWANVFADEIERLWGLEEQLDALLNAARKALPEDRRDDEGMIYRILGSTVELERVVERIDGSNPAREADNAVS